MPASLPTTEDIAAYRDGTLSIVRFEEVDAWLSTLPPDEQERLIGHFELPLSLAPLEQVAGVFTSELSAARFTSAGTLGEGGMGVVELVHDRLLDRQVAVKRCRPRGSDEPIAVHALRLRLFRREAAITARLEHPGIVPVHDVGAAAAGEPAYMMKRLTGTTLAARAPLPPAEAADILLRVADAVGFAHHAGIVHRDLKPEHIWLGAAGETLVIDWGLAGVTGSRLMTGSPLMTGALPIPAELLQPAEPNNRIGTPPWCAPETAATAPADPRMDVWAVGALLRFALTGVSPDVEPDVHHPLPKSGLGAIVTHCMQSDPARRYGTAAEVAADLRRWLRDGLALAEDPTWGMRALFASRSLIRRHPLVSVALLVVSLAMAGGVLVIIRERNLATQQAISLLAAPTPDAAGLRQWRDDMAALPATKAVLHARERIARALSADALRSLSQRYAHQGPWPQEIADLTAALVNAGCDPLAPDAATTLRQHPDRALLLPVATQLQRSLLIARKDSPLIAAIPSLINDAAPDDAWRSIANLLTRPIIGPHDLELCQCTESEAALHQADTADVLLATYAPDVRLAALATQRLTFAPGAFWPRITAGRAALMAQRIPEVRTHALVALGADPLSMWPHLLLAYAALADGDNVELAKESGAGLAANSAHLELQALHAAALARSGHLVEAQAEIDALNEAPHFQHHLHHRIGHPMERTVDALQSAGIHFNAGHQP